MKKLWNEFKAFIKRGNVLDLAVGVIIGGAFNKIVNSLVNDLIMPLINLALGDAGVQGLKWVLREEVKSIDPDTLVEVVKKTEIAITWGNFLDSLINFFIIALTLFIIIKVATSNMKRLERLKTETVNLSPKKRAKVEAMRLKEAEEAKIAEEKAAKEAEEAAAKAALIPTELSVLKEIRDMLILQNGGQINNDSNTNTDNK